MPGRRQDQALSGDLVRWTRVVPRPCSNFVAMGRAVSLPERLLGRGSRGIEWGVDPARFIAQGHFGLAGMRERAAMIGGKLDVQTARDYGTVVILELPR